MWSPAVFIACVYSPTPILKPHVPGALYGAIAHTFVCATVQYWPVYLIFLARRINTVGNSLVILMGFYHATACNATCGIAMSEMSIRLSVRPAVCLSVKRVDCDKTKETCAHILIPHEKMLVF